MGHLSNPGVWQFSKELPSKFHGSTDFYLPRAGHAPINPTFYLFPLLLCVWCVYVNVAYMLQYTNGTHRTTFQSWFCPSVLVLRQVFSYLWHAKYFRLADWWVSGLFFHDCLPPTSLLDYGITPPHPTFHVGSRDWTLVIRDERQGAFVHSHLSDFMCPAPNMGVRDPRACLAKAYRLSHHPETGDFKGVRLYRISANRN